MATKRTSAPAAKEPTPKSDSQPAPADNTNAVVSLVTGILSIMLPVIGIALGIVAIVYARKQRRIAPDSMATAGMVCGIIGLVFQVLVLLYLIFILVFFVAMVSQAVESGSAQLDVTGPAMQIEGGMPLPESCSIGWPFECVDFAAGASTIDITLLNQGLAIEDLQVRLSCPDGTMQSAAAGDVSSARIARLSFSCASSAGDDVIAKFEATYRRSGEPLLHTTSGALRTVAE